MILYLDHNATSPLRPEARAAMLAALDEVGNPSSIHGAGRKARGLVENARDAVGAMIGCDPKGIVFTSSGTEANNLVLTPHWRGCGFDMPFSVLLHSAVEHECVLRGGSFAREQRIAIPVDANGIVQADVLCGLLEQVKAQYAEPPLVSIMLANNETGVIQPISELAAIVHEFGALLHVDAAQAVGRIPVDMKTLGADILTFSAHKFGGPLGVGVIARRNHQLEIASPVIRGGGQEKGQRAGTENVPAIAGVGQLCSSSSGPSAARNRPEDPENYKIMDPRVKPEDEEFFNSQIENFITTTFPNAIIFGQNAPRLPNTTLFAIPGITAEKALMAFDIAGIALSSGSACSSGKVGKSHVLSAMGVADDLIPCAIRISTGWDTTQEEIQQFIAIAQQVLGRLLNRVKVA